MKTIFSISLASIYGLSIRLLYGAMQGIISIMSLAFLIIVPVVLGYLTVIFLPHDRNSHVLGAFFKPIITSLVLLAITIAANIEGAICWIMIFPLFAIFAGFGGILAFRVRRTKLDKNEGTEQKEKSPNTLNISLIMLIPLLVGFVEGERSSARKDFNIKKEVVITASSKEIWSSLVNINEIKQEEKHSSLSAALGFPQHISTTIDTLAVGGKRIALYEKGLHFDEIISKYETERLMVLSIKTDPSKIPANVMDEHILIGGKHVDILEDSYQLEDLGNGKCKLSLSSRFFINTPFNWYAGVWSDYLMSDILQSELDLVKDRVEKR